MDVCRFGGQKIGGPSHPETTPSPTTTVVMTRHGPAVSFILPHMYVGSVRALDVNCAALHELGVRNVVSVAPLLSHEDYAALQALCPTSTHGSALLLMTTSHGEFDMRFDRMYGNFETHVSHAVEAGQTVFVHCRAGRHRSIALVVAYMMLTFQMTWPSAFAYVKRRRGCASEHYRTTVERYVATRRAS